MTVNIAQKVTGFDKHDQRPRVCQILENMLFFEKVGCSNSSKNSPIFKKTWETVKNPKNYGGTPLESLESAYVHAKRNYSYFEAHIGGGGLTQQHITCPFKPLDASAARTSYDLVCSLLVQTKRPLYDITVTRTYTKETHARSEDNHTAQWE